jgi:PTH1 family peptidyl-tRNA hydrolase
MKFGGAFWPASQIEGESVAFLKPYTYMNLSGGSASEAARYYDIAPEEVLVVFDDVAMPFGTLRYRASGSAGGHNGMISIIVAFDTLDVPRLRIGVGGPPAEVPMRNWVLGKMSKDQRGAWSEVESAAHDALRKWLAGAPDGFTLKITGA